MPEKAQPKIDKLEQKKRLRQFYNHPILVKSRTKGRQLLVSLGPNRGARSSLRSRHR